MKEALWGLVGAAIPVLLGGGWYLARAQRRKLDAETEQTQKESRSKEVMTEISLANAAFEMYDKVDKRFEALDKRFEALNEKYREVRAQLLAAHEDVRAAINERHKCEEELDGVRERLARIEKNQRDRMQSETHGDP